MARTKQTARKSCGGKAPRKMMAATSSQQLRSFLTSRQMPTYAGTGTAKQQKTSYLNYENMFYSYSFSTGPPSTRPFEPRFTSGGCRNPISEKEEHWVGMSFNSMYDGPGMKTHGRPHLNLAIVLDISGSMGAAFDQDSEQRQRGSLQDKLTVAKQCLQSLTDQLKPSDCFGLVRFNHQADVHCPIKPWRSINKVKLRGEIGALRPYGATCLSAAIDCATQMFGSVGEGSHASSRVIFLTDLCSTVDSANDERKLLDTIRTNAERGIYTTVVGIGMDLNVRLVEEISKTRGAKYCSVDSTEEFRTIMNQEFDYDVTILAFNIRIELLTAQYFFAKGYGSPELNNLKPHKPVVISSEFPSCQDEQGQSKGGMLLFKLDTKQKKGKGSLPKELKIKVTWEDLSGVEHSQTIMVKLSDTFTESGTRKAALLVQYVDLHNDYVHDRRQHKTRFLELFQTFRSYFIHELEEMKDKSLATSNKGDLELLDKIIDLEQKPESQPTTSSTVATGLPYPTMPLFGAGSRIFPSPNMPRGFTVFRQTRRGMPAPKRLQKSTKQVQFATPHVSQQQVGTSPPRRSSRIAAAQSATSKLSTQPKARKRPLQSTQTSPSPSKVSRLQSSQSATSVSQSPKRARAVKQTPSHKPTQKKSSKAGHMKTQQSRVLRVTLKKETTTSIVATRHSVRASARKRGKQ